MAEQGDAPNIEEVRRWNDNRWTASWVNREKLTDATGPTLFAALRLKLGERALEIGSGGGGVAIEAGRLVGPTGSVVGADLSSSLTALARQRTEDAVVDNVSFMVADMQIDRVEGGPFDIAFSRFGVMFFADPVAGFSNIRSHLSSSGRLTFVCWQTVTRNPWHTGPTLAPFVPPPAKTGPAPGPFSFGDPQRTTGILDSAGFTSIRHDDIGLSAIVDRSAIFEESLLEFYGVAEQDRRAAAEAVDTQLARFRVGSDSYDIPLAITVYQASA